jgi:hypothetical protein
MPHDVFIGHASHDCEVAFAACAALERRGISCWLEPRDVAPGGDRRAAAAAALGQCRLVVLIVSAATADEPRIGSEAEGAGWEGKPLVALRLADTQPAGALGNALAVAHWVDAFTPPIAAHLDHLGDRVAGLLDGSGPGPLQPTLPPRPLPPRRSRAAYWLPIVGAGAAGLLAIAAVAMYVARPQSAEAADERR